MAGYNLEEGMSNNAVDAYEKGRKPLSRFSLQDLRDEGWSETFQTALNAAEMCVWCTDEWHHSRGHVYAKVYFYDIKDLIWEWKKLSKDEKEEVRNFHKIPEKFQDQEVRVESLRQPGKEKLIGTLKNGWVHLDGGGKRLYRNENITWSRRCILPDIPYLQRTRELCVDALEKNKNELIHVPTEFKDSDFFIEVIRKSHEKEDEVPLIWKNRFNLEDVYYKTEKLCKEAVKYDWKAFLHIPNKYITEKVCWDAVNCYPHNLEYVPAEFLSKKLCLHAVKLDSLTLEYTPIIYIDNDFCLEVVKSKNASLGSIPYHLRTEEVCRIACDTAVKKGYCPSIILQHVPDELQNDLQKYIEDKIK